MEADPFLQSFDSSDLQIAKEFLTNWLPFVTKDLCEGCAASLFDRIQSLSPVNEQNPSGPEAEEVDSTVKGSELGDGEEASVVAGGADDSFRVSTAGWEHIKATGWDIDPAPESPMVRMSWADELEEEEEEARKSSLEDGMEEGKGEVKLKKTDLSRDWRERLRYTSVGRKKDFVCLERVDGKIVNILEGIELHTKVFSAAEQRRIVDFVYELQEKGRNNELGEHTYSEEFEPRKNPRGKGRMTIQFGCCYNYVEQNGIPPGILRDVVADPIPNLLKIMIKRLIGWHVMPASCVPDCCSINIYDPGDFVQPTIDSHDFLRPFCTVSLVNECSVAFGRNLKDDDAGEFSGSTAIPLPVGSVLVLSGNGANVAQHCLPAVPSKRISITFRKMEKNKWPLGFRLEPDLQNIRPYDLDAGTESQRENNEKDSFVEIRTIGRGRNFNERSNGAKGRWNSKKDRASVFDRITPTKKSSHPFADPDFTVSHSSIERVRDSRSFFESEYEAGLKNHQGRVDEADELLENKACSERSVRVEQKRIIITRNLDRDDSLATRNPVANPVHSQVRIRTLKNNQRRVRMNQ